MTDDPRTVSAEAIEAAALAYADWKQHTEFYDPIPVALRGPHRASAENGRLFMPRALLAASREIDCGCTWDNDSMGGAGRFGADDDCPVCGGSGRLRVLL